MKKNKEKNTESVDNRNDEDQALDETKEVKTEQSQAGQQPDMQEDKGTSSGLNAVQDVDEKDEIIEHLKLELENAKDTVLRKVAEYDNLKKRLQKDKIQFYRDSKILAVKSFLPIRDDLKRSLEASEKIDIDEGFLAGIQMVAGKFEKVLEDLGITPIDEEMIPFDVEVHDALLRQPTEDDDIEPNTVLKVIEPGYKLEDYVIKHAKVIVSQ
ncbi:MAG: nucleotide exchange factor GrpE [Balneolales bacterium]